MHILERKYILDVHIIYCKVMYGCSVCIASALVPDRTDISFILYLASFLGIIRYGGMRETKDAPF